MLAVDVGSLRGDYLEEIRLGSRDTALSLVLEPVETGTISLSDFYDEVLGPVAARVGDLWHAGAMTVADEHFATSVNREARLRARRLFEPGPRNGRRLLLGCAPEEQHDLGLHMAGDVLELAGYEVHVLGARMPSRDLASYAGRTGADAVVLSCSSPLTITGLIESVSAAHAQGLPVLVGGRAVAEYPAVAIAAGADGSCSRTGDVVAAIDVLLSR